MSVVRINRHPTGRELGQFGLVWLGFLTLFGGVAWFRFDSPTVATVLWLLAVVVPVTGWLIPALMRLVYLAMSYLAWPIGFVVSHVVLAVVYYLVVTPIGLVMRLLRYDPLRRRFDRSAESYWIERKAAERGPARYFRQF
jgi:hypothetical protein